MDWSIAKTLSANFVLSVCAGISSHHFMKQFIPLFIQRKLYGLDQCKVDKKPVAEPMGVVAAAIYLIFILVLIPIHLNEWINEAVDFSTNQEHDCHCLENVRLSSLLAAIVSICLSILLGFGDDMLDLRWRHKLVFPLLSALPLLLIYYYSKSSTAMLLPRFFREWVGATYIDFGALFYIFLVMLVIFCTNTINIIAGINGVEVGQSIVIALSVAIFNVLQIFRLQSDWLWHNVLSLCILMPFISCSFALFLLNKYPARVFVGDTYCYWAGMTLAVAAIIGHFSKTLLLFLIPQIFNFLYSVPQLFHFIPCPRHRLPKLNTETGRLQMSVAEFQPHKLGVGGRACFDALRMLRLIYWRNFEKDGESWVEINNLTILNFLLKFTGPLYEWQLTNMFLVIQMLCSIFAFVCRFYLAYLLYEMVQ